MQPPPKELLIRASEGDAEAFEQIYRATADYVYTIAVGITGNRADAEEVAQDVFVKVHRGLGRFRFEASFTTWLYRITVNRALTEAKRSGRRRARRAEFDDGMAVEDPRNATRETVEREENETRVRFLLKGLRPEQRACIVMREMDGMRYGEIARARGVKLKTVRSGIRRAREALGARGRAGGGME